MNLLRTSAAALLFASSLLTPSTAAEPEFKSYFEGYTWKGDGAFPYCPGPTPPNDDVCLAYLRSWSGSILETSVAFWYRIDDSSGLLRTNLKILNNQWADGDTVCFVSVWSDADWKPTYVFSHRWGVDAYGWKFLPFDDHENQREQYEEFQVPIEIWRNTEHVSFGMRECDKVDDRGFWEKAIDLAEAACIALTGDPDECNKEAGKLHAINGSEKSESGEDYKG